MPDELTDRVLTIVAEFQGVPRERVTSASTFDELGMDSLGAVALVAELEGAFDLSIANEDVIALRDVGQAIACLRRYLPEGEAGTGPAANG